MIDNKIVLIAEQICKTFDVTKAVDHVSLILNRGEIRGLIGENGSGKSTFVAMLCGIYTTDSGSFILDGEEYKPKNQVDAHNKGVSIIVQERGNLPGLTVAENIFLGNESQYTRFGVKNVAKMNRDANDILERYGFNHIKANVIIDNYDFESRKMIELVRATYSDTKIFVVDETTTALSHGGREELYKRMNMVRDAGGTVIFISHDLNEVLEKTDAISVFRDGKYIDTVNSSEVSEDDLKKMMVGRETGNRYYRTDYDHKVSDRIVLKADAVSVPGAIENIDLELHSGEILGVGGLSESGMHELGKALFGASYDRKGSVTAFDNINIDSITTAIKNKIAYTSKDRDTESVVLNMSIGDNICLPSLAELKQGPVLKRKTQRSFAQKNAESMSVKMQGIDQFVSQLSGGNKQKVVLARWLGKNSDIYIFDSPTRGIDIKVKADIYELMEKLKAEGKSIIMISEEIMELIGMSDRIIIMKDGSINGEFLRNSALCEEDLIRAMV